METTGKTPVQAKKPWHRPDFAFFGTALEVTAYSGRG